ncbi:chloride channel protein 2-like [Ascaphus truei]|uniref:chloride channel protein 2-like n=1 Tax=Ascaphus truei TaxID=8439 RepID=UPI003F591766
MVEEWEVRQLNEIVRLDDLTIDSAPYRLVEKETLYQCYDLFNLLGLRSAYVTSTGRLVGVISLQELKDAVQGTVKGTFTPREPPKTEEADPLHPLQPLTFLLQPRPL